MTLWHHRNTATCGTSLAMRPEAPRQYAYLLSYLYSPLQCHVYAVQLAAIACVDADMDADAREVPGTAARASEAALGEARRNLVDTG
jgi:hypothetical protein